MKSEIWSKENQEIVIHAPHIDHVIGIKSAMELANDLMEQIRELELYEAENKDSVDK